MTRACDVPELIEEPSDALVDLVLSARPVAEVTDKPNDASVDIVR